MDTKTHFQVRDTKTHTSVQGCHAMMVDDNARYVAQRLNRRSRAKSRRYVVIRVDPDNLPMACVPHVAADEISEF